MRGAGLRMKPWALARAMREAEAMTLETVFCMVKVVFVLFVLLESLREGAPVPESLKVNVKNECGCSRSDRDLFELSLLEV
jgi:hypothetical protein